MEKSSTKQYDTPESLNGLSNFELAKIAKTTEVVEIQELLADHGSPLILTALWNNSRLAQNIRDKLRQERPTMFGSRG